MPKASRKELRKSLFKQGSSARTEAKKKAKEKHEEIEASKPPVPPPKKRFILFVGNLPYDVKEEQIRDHFKNCNISSLRLRPKGICFLEFLGPNASQDLHHALKFHHTSLGERRINVELSAGGGGNSKARREKIKQKNEAYQDEMKSKQKTQSVSGRGSSSDTPSKSSGGSAPVSISTEEAAAKGINPARLAALKKS